MLSRDECLKILELASNANRNEIETRYTMLIKRYRGLSDDQTLAHLDEITMAYNILTDRYVEPIPVNPRLEKVVFGKTLAQWKNIWYYGRWPLLGISLALALVIYLVVTVVTNKRPDFQVVAVGQFEMAENATELIQASVIAKALPEAARVMTDALPLQFGADDSTPGYDAQNQYTYIMKMMTLIAADNIDVFVCDQPVFEYYARQHTFQDLSGLYARLQASGLPAETLAGIKPVRRHLNDELEPSATSPTAETSAAGEATTTRATLSAAEQEVLNLDPRLPIFGLDVTALNLTGPLGLDGTSQILTIGIRCKQVAVAERWLENLILASGS